MEDACDGKCTKQWLDMCWQVYQTVARDVHFLFLDGAFDFIIFLWPQSGREMAVYILKEIRNKYVCIDHSVCSQV